MERKATSGESKRKETKPQREPPPSSAAAAAVAADDTDDEEKKDAPVAVAAVAEEEKKRRSAPSPLPPTLSAPSCQAERCAVDLTEVTRYRRRHKLCEAHSKAHVVVIAGLRQCFCQQCSREQDRDLGNEVTIGKLLEDLDALSGTIAVKALMYPLLVAYKSISILRRRAAQDVVDKIC